LAQGVINALALHAHSRDGHKRKMLALLLCFLLPRSSALGRPSPIVETGDGSVQGTCNEHGTCAYLGLPYAAPPIGDLRWRPPQPAPSWEGVRQATDFGDNCLQVQGAGDSIHGNESCLFLNVWVPANCSSCAVLFWIHGGSYVTGGTKDMYNGTGMVEIGDVIIVTANYRLGIMGFAGSEHLRPRDAKGGSTGNYGIQDQRAALEWLQANIDKFGGNRSNVMLFGESAGAGSIAMHLTMKRSWPLYQKAALESGAFSYWNAQPMHDAERQFNDLVEATGCYQSGHAALQCLLQMDAANLTAIATMQLNPEPLPEAWKAYGTFFSPTVDGVEVESLPWELLKVGDFNKQAAVLMGFNKDEGTIIASCMGTPKCKIFEKGFNMTQGDFETLLTTDLFNLSVAQLPEALRIYGANATGAYPNWYWAAAHFYGDYEISCPTRRAARAVEKFSQHAPFVYLFAQSPGSKSPAWAGMFGKNGTVGASHGSELGFIWLGEDGWQLGRGASTGGWQLLGPELPLAKRMATYWTNFAKSSNPNNLSRGPTPAEALAAAVARTELSASPIWSPFVEGSEAMLELRLPTPFLTIGSYEEQCDFMDSLGPMVEGYVSRARRLEVFV